MLTVITYQITDNKTRLKLNKLLKSYGNPVQNSVFECRLTREQQKDMLYKLESIKPLLSEGDSIRIYPLCIKCIKNVRITGKIPLTENQLYYIV